MSMIDIGDLVLSQDAPTLQQALFDAIQKKIIDQNWKKKQKLPSTRKMAEELKLSRNTVTGAYEQLVAEGYLLSKKGSGFYVSVSIPEYFLKAKAQFKPGDKSVDISPHSKTINPPTLIEHPAGYLNRPFSPGIPDLAQFPYIKWQRILHRHTGRSSLAGSVNLQGYLPLREALSQYLQSSRSVSCHPNRVIITSGAQQALSIAALVISQKGKNILMEEPGYTQMRKVLDLFAINTTSIDISSKLGIDINSIKTKKASAIYLTPSNQYPMGTSLNTEKRLQVLQWAEQNRSWVIEDDYDSEFQFSHRPYPSLQGLSAQSGFSDRCIYIGSFSKTMFNGMRVGYMVVPEELVEQCVTIKDAIGGSTTIHNQAALADFISEGHFLRHLRKMRKIYQQKSETIRHAIADHFGSDWDIISQAAGLHITVSWRGLPSENCLSEAAGKEGITVRPLSYYEHHSNQRTWNALVLGYGNVNNNQIEPLVSQLKLIYLNLLSQ